jgi:hypothetical protein
VKAIDLRKPFHILEGKRVGDYVLERDYPEYLLEFLVLGTERWANGRINGFGHIKPVGDGMHLILSLPWQNLNGGR